MEGAKYKVMVSERGKQMLAAHIRFLDFVNPEAAKAKKQQIMAALRLLEQTPKQFPLFETAQACSVAAALYRKMLAAQWYVVLYQIQNDTVYVDCILDGHEDSGWLLYGI